MPDAGGRIGVMLGRVAPGLTPWRSHRSVRAQLIKAYGSSRAAGPDRRTPAEPLGTFQRGYGDKERSLKVLPLVPHAGSARRQRPSLPWLLRGEFASFD